MQATISVVPSKAPGRAVLRVQGELDLASAELLATELRKVEEAHVVVADLRSVTFLDSTALGTLVHFDFRMRGKNGVFALLIGDGQVTRTLELTGLIDQLTIVHSLDEL
jgi:anti-anti-sigma factor